MHRDYLDTTDGLDDDFGFYVDEDPDAAYDRHRDEALALVSDRRVRPPITSPLDFAADAVGHLVMLTVGFAIDRLAG